MIRRLVILCAVIGLAASSAGCAGRQPTTAKAEKVIYSYFKKYGKKYPTTIYGQNPVSEVDVLSMMELHKDYVHVMADVLLAGGGRERIRAALEKKLPGGWHFVAWEQSYPAADLPQNDQSAE